MFEFNFSLTLFMQFLAQSDLSLCFTEKQSLILEQATPAEINAFEKGSNLERNQARVTFSSNLRKWCKSGYKLYLLNDNNMVEGNVPQNIMAILHSGSLLMSTNIFNSINENFYRFIANYCVLTSGHGKKTFFLKGEILLHYYSHSTLEKCDPLTAEIMHCILFYKILKVRMSHQSTDSVANDPPGEPAWPRWTEKGEGESPRARMKCCTL